MSVLNVDALRAHLGVSKLRAKQIDKLAADLGVKTTSIAIYESGGPECDYGHTKRQLTVWGGREVHGITVIRPLDGIEDARIGFSIVVPWHLLMKGQPTKGHMVYGIELRSAAAAEAELKQGGHVSPSEELSSKEIAIRKDGGKARLDAVVRGRIPIYIGKTSVGLANRFKQHIVSSVRGSKTRFHVALGGNDKYYPMIPRMFAIGRADTEEGAYALEEEQIADHGLNPKTYLLNTLHSREAFAKLLAEFPDLATERNREQAEEILAAKAARASAMWDDPTTAEAIICGNGNNFDGQEVRMIRLLGRMGESPVKIAKSLGVAPQRVNKVLTGATYSRVS